MVRVIQSIIFILLLSSCHQGSSYMSRYGQSIVLNPSETQSISGNTETISDQKLTSLIKPNTKPNKIKTFDQNTFKNINFSTTAACIFFNMSKNIFSIKLIVENVGVEPTTSRMQI